MVKYAKKKPNITKLLCGIVTVFACQLFGRSSEQELTSSMALNTLPSHYRLVQFRIGRPLNVIYPYFPFYGQRQQL